MHFLIILGFMPVARRLANRLAGSIRVHVTYEEGHAVMSTLLLACERRNWQLAELESDPAGGVQLTLSGNGVLNAPTVLARIDGVTAIRQIDDDPD
jgi:putative Mg2+ transporter-C (MgtC) family protein